MTGHIRLSHNEYRALLNRVGESAWGHTYDSWAVAQNMLWLSAHDLGELADFVVLMSTQVNAPPVPEIVESGTGVTVMGSGQSLLLWAHGLADLLEAHAFERACAQVEPVGFMHPYAALASLNLCAQAGLYAQLFWAGGMACIGPKQSAPDMYGLPVEGNLHFYGARACQDLPEVKYDTVNVESDRLAHCYTRNLQNGLFIPVKDYQLLNQLADRLLVIDSDISRKGAGA